MPQEPWTLMTGLESAMAQLHIGPEDLAAILGIHVRTVYRWRAGDCLPDLPTLFFLAHALHVAPIDLIPSLKFAPQQLTRHQEATA